MPARPLSCRILFLTVILFTPAAGFANTWPAPRLYQFTEEICRDRDAAGLPVAEDLSLADDQMPLEFRGFRLGTRYHFEVEEAALIELDIVERGGRITRFVSSLRNRFGDPLLLVSLDGDCALTAMRRIDYTEQGQALGIVSLDQDFEVFGDTDWLNPPLAFVERDSAPAPERPGDASPVRVALVDSGVNYQIPEINRRLARDESGRLIGFDFWDMDAQPFDAHPVQLGFFLQRHGTRTASILLREAPHAELVPYRYPRPDMSRMRALIDDAARNDVAIVGMPLGSDRIGDWITFERAAREHPEILFIASAGNDGRNIDERPLYPASLGLDNLLVVTSSDDFVRPADSTNWGRISVDYMVPAERIDATDFYGRSIRVSGSSYAVARVAALAARLVQDNPEWRAGDIIAELERRYSQAAPGAQRWVSSGYIGDPRADGSLRWEVLPEPAIELARATDGYLLPLDVLILDQRWAPRVASTLQRAFEILGQCEITAGDLSVRVFEGADYLRDLSTGSARTLFENLSAEVTRVVFARDTRMQEAYTGEAFGLANTRKRPWLANSVWLTLDVDDPAIALAHELYHVLANDGSHVEGVANLMQGRTRPDAITLTAGQCLEAQLRGLEHGLMKSL